MGIVSTLGSKNINLTMQGQGYSGLVVNLIFGIDLLITKSVNSDVIYLCYLLLGNISFIAMYFVMIKFFIRLD